MNPTGQITDQVKLPWRDRLLALFRRRGWRGFPTLHRWLNPAGARRELLCVTRYGSRFFLNPWDGVDTHVLLEGFYESEVLDAVRPSLERGGVLWVIGANFGLHAVTAKFLHPDVTVVAFEPSPAMAARVLEHSEINGAPIDLQAYALSDQSGARPFFANNSGNPGMSTLHPVGNFKYDQRFVVATQSAAEVIDRGFASPPNAMILDAEGAEIEVLRGFGRHLASPSLRALVFETGNDFLDSREPAELHALVTAAGFTVRKLVRNESTAHGLSNFLATRP